MSEPVESAGLDRETLRDVIDLALWAGQLVMQHGAASRRVEQTVHRIGTSLGCDWMDVLVSPNAIIATTSSGDEFRTKVRRVIRRGVDMQRVTEISHMTHQVQRGEIGREEVRAELEQISQQAPNYSRWVVAMTVGLACAAFSRLFGGDWVVFGVTVLAASLATVVRQMLTARHFNTYLVTIVTAFTAGLIASTATVFHLSPQPETALAASVLLLVPGVPLINGAQDMIRGHMVVGLVHGMTGVLIAWAIALGLMLAMRLMGLSGL